MNMKNSNPMQIPLQQQQQMPQQQMMPPSSYTMTPPNSNIMSSSSFSPLTTAIFSPSYFNTPSSHIQQQTQMQQQQQQQYYSQAAAAAAASMSSSMSSPSLQPLPPLQPQQLQPPLQLPQLLQAQGQIKTYKIYRPYFQLEMYCPRGPIRNTYEKIIEEHNQAALTSILGHPGEFNAGFDLLAPTAMTIHGYNTVKVDHLVKCKMTKIIPHSSHSINVYQESNGLLRQYNTSILPVGFYLYPRSSTGTKTPLRLANSVGIIDSGYRGPLIAAFDNWKQDEFLVQEGQRLVQICAPDLSYPLYIILVDKEEDLGKTIRGSGGFGSTGV
jgi:dUTP pyrophosphatase